MGDKVEVKMVAASPNSSTGKLIESAATAQQKVLA